MDFIPIKAIVFALAIISPSGDLKDDFLVGVFEDTVSCEHAQYHAEQMTPEFFQFLEENEIYGVPSLLTDGSKMRYTACHELNLALLPRCAAQ